MWRVLDNLVRKLNSFWYEGIRGNMRSKEQEKSQTTTTDESYESGDDDSGFADDEGLYYYLSSGGGDAGLNRASTRHQHSDVESDESSENENESVLDSDVKNQQRITLLSLLYSRALERKLNEARTRKPSYTLSLKKHK